jgi:hypothetical protein
VALSPAGSRIASGAALGAALALAFALFALMVTLPLLRSSGPAQPLVREARERGAPSWPNAPAVARGDAGLPRFALFGSNSPDAGALTKTAGTSGVGPLASEEAAPAVAEQPAEQPAETRAAPIESSATCGNVTCPEGQVCCNPSCGICAKPGEQCTQFVCGMSQLAMSVSCGPNTCNVGDVCCNASCGICTKPGAKCDTRQCSNPPAVPFSETCGLATCNVGTVCCNPSCGICAKPGVPCRREPC